MPRLPTAPLPIINWTCPFCNRPQTVTSAQRHVSRHHLKISEHKYPGEVGFSVTAIGCANPECHDVMLSVDVEYGSLTGDSIRYFVPSETIEKYQLRPSYLSKRQPDYIPQQLRDDYTEACKIRDLSPKASATLARRVLQGMIRDFCGIAKNRLIEEIRELRRRVDTGDAPRGVQEESGDAIDHVRNIGNIGAHMEADINVIVDVDPGEAQALIELVELLFDEWYVARHKRNERLEKVRAISEQKDQEKKVGRAKLDENAEGQG